MIEISVSIKEELRAYYQRTDAPVDDAERSRVVRMVSEVVTASSIDAQEATMPFWRFIVRQLRFVSPLAWVSQVALIAGMLLVVDAYGGTDSTMLVVMVTAVLSVAIATPTVFKSFENDVAELEASCRHDSTQVLVSRLVLFGLSDVLWMTLAVCLIPAIAGGDPFQVFLYAATPFFAFCALSFYLSRITNGHCVKPCAAAAFGVIAAIWASSEMFPHWYSEASMVVWSLALFVALALAAYEAHKLVAQVAANGVSQFAFAARI